MTLLCKPRAIAVLQKRAFFYSFSHNETVITVMWIGFLANCDDLLIHFLRDDIKLMPFTHVSAGSILHLHIALMKLINCCATRSQIITLDFWPPKSPYFYPVDYRIWITIQECVYHTDIQSVDELKQRLIQIWSILTTTLSTRPIGV